MPKAKIYDLNGKAVGERDLKADVFGVKVNPHVVHEVLINLEANARRPWAHTKTRGEVRGGGKKPWKQKGTGRARQGSSRSPIWTGGGITFGPRSERSYDKKINKKAKTAAFLMSLSDKAANDRIVLVEKLSSAEGKTKATVSLLGKLPVKGKLGLVPAGRDELLTRSARNLRQVRVLGLGHLGLADVLGADYLVMSPEAVSRLEARYAKQA